MSFVICALASGSKGNAVLIRTEGRALLIDAGLAAGELNRRMALSGLPRPDAVLFTHTHIDHIRGARALAAKGLPLYVFEGDLPFFRELGCPEQSLIPFRQSAFRLAGLEILPVPVPHDTPFCHGFVIDDGGERAAYFTDLGRVIEPVREAVKGCRTLFLESNHDPELLKKGPYPYPLKRRILSERGHLSNPEAAELCRFAVQHGTREIMLGHLSAENNLPELCFSTCEAALREAGLTEGRDFTLSVACQERAVVAGLSPALWPAITHFQEAP